MPPGSSAVLLVRCCCFRVASFSVLSKYKFRVLRLVRAYVDVSGDDHYETSAKSISVSEAE
jgi:hypothetical protein